EGLRDRRQPGHRARPPQGRGRQGPARRQSHGPAADRLDAARADAREHRSLRPQGLARAARGVERRGLGEPLVAGAAARRRRPAGHGRCRRMTREQTITVWQGKVRMRVLSEGAGPALVFFHGPWGLTWDPFLAELARTFTVYAPEHPGTTPDAPDDVYHLDGLWDLARCYDELLTALGLESAAFLRHSCGGMVASELAAAYPDRARRLALI